MNKKTIITIIAIVLIISFFGSSPIIGLLFAIAPFIGLAYIFNPKTIKAFKNWRNHWSEKE